MARKKKPEPKRRLAEEVIQGIHGRKGFFSGDEIAEAAELYDVPYNSYGKLRAYLTEHGHMPPAEFLKRMRENRVQPWQF